MATLHWMLPIQESPDQGGHSAKVTDETRLKALWVIRSGSLDPAAPVCYGRASNGERGRGKHEQGSVPTWVRCRRPRTIVKCTVYFAAPLTDWSLKENQPNSFDILPLRRRH